MISKLAGSMLAYAAAQKALRLAEGVQTTFAKYDDLVRYQRVVMEINEAQQKTFIDQATEAAGTSGYSTLDVGKAQLDLAQRGVNKDFIQPIVSSAIAFGQATDVDLSTAAKTMEGIIFSTGKHLDDLATAIALAPKVVNEAVRLTKIGGFTGEGVREFYEYAGLAGSSAGLSDKTIDTIGAIMQRASFRQCRPASPCAPWPGVWCHRRQRGSTLMLRWVSTITSSPLRAGSIPRPSRSSWPAGSASRYLKKSAAPSAIFRRSRDRRQPGQVYRKRGGRERRCIRHRQGRQDARGRRTQADQGGEGLLQILGEPGR